MKCAAWIFSEYCVNLKFCELVVAPDVGVVGRQGHQEVDQGHHNHHAGRRRQDKHHLDR